MPNLEAYEASVTHNAHVGGSALALGVLSFLMFHLLVWIQLFLFNEVIARVPWLSNFPLLFYDLTYVSALFGALLAFGCLGRWATGLGSIQEFVAWWKAVAARSQLHELQRPRHVLGVETLTGEVFGSPANFNVQMPRGRSIYAEHTLPEALMGAKKDNATTVQPGAKQQCNPVRIKK